MGRRLMNYGEKRCGDCRHLRWTDAFRGKVAVRCMNPKNGHRCGWVIDYQPEELQGQISIIRPVWCRKGARSA